MIKDFLNNREKRISAGSLIYLIYFLLMISARALGMYEGTLIYTVVLVIAMLLFAAGMIITPHTLKEYMIAGAVMFVSAIVYLHTGEKGLIVCFATLLGMKYVDKDKVLHHGTIAAGICILGRICLGVFGITPEKYYLQYRAGAGAMFRHSLGYAHPNTLHMNVLMLTMLITYTVTRRLHSADKRTGAKTLVFLTLILAGLNVYVFSYSGSRTGLLVSVIYMIINLWFYLMPDPGIIQKAVCYAAYPMVCLLAIAAPVALPDKLFTFFDDVIFNSRFTIARYFWSHNGISVWGIRLNNPDPLYKTYGLDMAHLYLFLQLGIVAFLLISAFTLIYVHESLKNKRMTELAVLLGTLCAGIWEPYLYNLGFKNFTYVFMGALLYELISSSDVRQTDTKNHVEDDLSPYIKNRLLVNRVLIVLAACALSGLIASSVYIAATKEPSALYAANALDESGYNPGIKEIYLTESDIAALKENGDLIIDYSDENTPMYEYDRDTAVSEYHRKAASTGVWIAIAVFLILYPAVLKGYVKKVMAISSGNEIINP